MVFSSLYFLFLFLPVVMVVYFLVPKIFLKNVVLLIASLYFYAWGEPVYVVLMVFSALFNYVIGLDIDRREGASRKLKLIVSVVVNLFILGFFKYYDFAIETVNGILGLDIPVRDLALPIGISFYTFQTMSYIIDVYRRKVPAQKSFLKFAVYITMFPQLIAGPIVVYADVAEQLTSRQVTPINFGKGMERFIRGMVKKVILANNLGLLYTTIQGLDERSVLTAWLGIIAYTMQIYFDFSGYSDMAIGLGKMFGFDFIENFNYPYIANTITEFWRRWHISLSSWFRDYVYIPLGGNRVAKRRHIINLFIVWMLTGLWHGASWNFVFWGVYYGVLLIIEKYVLGDRMERWPAAVKHIYTMVLVMVGWVFFSNTVFTEALAYAGQLIGIGATVLMDSASVYYLKSNLILLVIGAITCAPGLNNWYQRMVGRRPVLGVVINAALYLLCIAYLVSNSYNPFLYFRF